MKSHCSTKLKSEGVILTLKKIWLKKASLILGMLLITVLPHVAHAAAGSLPTKNDKTIVIKDTTTGAVIYKSQNIYYYGLPGPVSSSPINQGQINPNEIIVKYKNQGDVSVQSLNSINKVTVQLGAKTVPLNDKLRLAVVKLNKTNDYFKTLRELSKNPNVVYAEPNYVAHIDQTPNDPYYGQEWGPKDIHADLAWDKVDPAKRSAVTIAVLDTGINLTHEDLQNDIVPGYNFINNDGNPADGNGHGTHVAGIAAAIINNGKGIAGIAGGAKIMPIKVMDDSGSGSYSTIINGVRYAADHGAKVISMSLGGSGTSQAMQDAVDYATSHGVSVVAASGNNNGAVSFPGNCNGVITVGAIDSNNQRASFSNYGPEMDVVAPGVNIISSFKNGDSSYTAMSGTSMATPFVSGVAALVRAANPSLSTAAVTNIIDQSATDLGTAGFDNYYGYGLVDANKAVSLAMQGQNGAPAPTPTPTPSPGPIPVPTPGNNLALHKTAVVSSVEGSTRTADKAVDGDGTTRWASQTGIDPQYIYVDLGRTYNINKVVLKWENAYAKSYLVYVSNDGQYWTPLYSTTMGSGGTNILNLNGQGRYVLVYGTQRGTPYGYSLWEFEVYGH